MKKSISINLGGYNFYIEEDAYAKLDTYLSSIKKHFSNYPDNGEVADDIEARLAEHFLAKGSSPETRVITLADVEEMITIMGTVDDVTGKKETEETGTESEKTEAVKTKKFFRNPDDTMIAGVCSGIAAYFGIDVTLVRLVFVASIFFGGFGILLYLILMIITPEAKTPVEKMQMRGEPVTLAGFEDMIKKKINVDPKQAEEKINILKNIIRLPFIWLGKIFTFIVKGIIPLIGKIAGLALVIASIFGIVFLTFTFAAFIFNIDSPYWNFPLQLFITSTPHYILLTSAYIVALIPLIFCGRLGAYIIGRKKFSATLGLTMLGIWIVALSVGGILAIRLAPGFEATAKNLPEFQTTSKNVTPSSFSKVDINGAYVVNVIDGTEYKVEITGKVREVENTSATTTDDTLYIRRARHYNCFFFCDNRTFITVTVPNLSEVSLKGATKLDAIMTAPTSTINLYGASTANITVTTTALIANLEGASELIIKGTAERASAELNGASYLDARKLMLREAALELMGASTADVYILEKLHADGYGASRIYVTGSPTTTGQMYGAARVIPTDDEKRYYR